MAAQPQAVPATPAVVRRAPRRAACASGQILQRIGRDSLVHWQHWRHTYTVLTVSGSVFNYALIVGLSPPAISALNTLPPAGHDAAGRVTN
jgi:hypothetical protein